MYIIVLSTSLYNKYLENFHLAKLILYTYWITTPLSLLPQTPGNLFSVCLRGLTTLEPSYEWNQGFPPGTVVKDPPVNADVIRDLNLIPGSGRFSGVGSGSSLLYSCPRKIHGQRSLVGYNPWDHKEFDTAEHAHKYK